MGHINKLIWPGIYNEVFFIIHRANIFLTRSGQLFVFSTGIFFTGSRDIVIFFTDVFTGSGLTELLLQSVQVVWSIFNPRHSSKYKCTLPKERPPKSSFFHQILYCTKFGRFYTFICGASMSLGGNLFSHFGGIQPPTHPQGATLGRPTCQEISYTLVHSEISINSIV